jgi:hypothetical protein
LKSADGPVGVFAFFAVFLCASLRLQRLVSLDTKSKSLTAKDAKEYRKERKDEV